MAANTIDMTAEAPGVKRLQNAGNLYGNARYFRGCAMDERLEGEKLQLDADYLTQKAELHRTAAYAKPMDQSASSAQWHFKRAADNERLASAATWQARGNYVLGMAEVLLHKIGLG